MKKIIFFTLLICFSVSVCFAQQKKTSEKVVGAKPVQVSLTLKDISEADWKILTDALKAERLEESSRLAAEYLEKLKTDNEKSQLAQLRYFYLYSLAGKILKFSAAKNAVEENAAWQKLDEAVGKFTGKKFVLPPRRFLPACKEVLNYICAVTDNDHALRVTATNKAGTEIHSFDYILFDEKFSFNKSNDSPETKIFLGGTLRKAEFNQDLSKRWVMRLIFENGFVTTAPDGK